MFILVDCEDYLSVVFERCAFKMYYLIINTQIQTLFSRIFL